MDDGSVIVTGGKGFEEDRTILTPALKKVTRYTMDEADEIMSELTKGRHSHGCGSFINDAQDQVDMSFFEQYKCCCFDSP